MSDEDVDSYRETDNANDHVVFVGSKPFMNLS